MKIDWKKIAPYLVALVVFIGFAVIYCSPLLEGKVLHAGDEISYKGASQEIREYRESTGEQVQSLKHCNLSTIPKMAHKTRPPCGSQKI